MPFSLAVSCYGDRMALMPRSSRVQGGSCPFGKMQYLRPLPQNNPRSAVLLPYRSYSRLGMWTWRPVYVRPTTDFSPYRPKRCVSWLSVSLPSTCRSLSILIPPPALLATNALCTPTHDLHPPSACRLLIVLGQLACTGCIAVVGGAPRCLQVGLVAASPTPPQ